MYGSTWEENACVWPDVSIRNAECTMQRWIKTSSRCWVACQIYDKPWSPIQNYKHKRDCVTGSIRWTRISRSQSGRHGTWVGYILHGLHSDHGLSCIVAWRHHEITHALSPTRSSYSPPRVLLQPSEHGILSSPRNSSLQQNTIQEVMKKAGFYNSISHMWSKLSTIIAAAIHVTACKIQRTWHYHGHRATTKPRISRQPAQNTNMQACRHAIE